MGIAPGSLASRCHARGLLSTLREPGSPNSPAWSPGHEVNVGLTGQTTREAPRESCQGIPQGGKTPARTSAVKTEGRGMRQP